MDRAIVHYAQTLIGRFPFFDGIAVFFAAFLPYIFVTAFIIFLFVPNAFSEPMPLLRKKRRLQFVLTTFLAVLIASGIIEPFINYLYGRVRPFAEFGWTPLVAHETNPSFPSSHATLMFTLAASIWQLHKKWGYWFFACASLIGIARVYALMHYPTDILAGAAFGILAVFAVQRIVRVP